MRRVARRSAPLLAAALVGGGIAAGVAVAVDDDGPGAPTTTIVDAAAARDSGDSGEDDASSQLTSFGGDAAEDLAVQEIYRRAAPGVVLITTTAGIADEDEVPLDPFGFGPRSGLGSGFVIDRAGHIITNYHVVEGAEQVFVTFSDDERIEAKVLGSDPSTDIAVLEIDAEGRALTPLALGDSDGVEVGDTAIAIGNPFGLDRTVTKGIVSAIQREIRAPDGFQIEGAIQTDAAINRGNSGGPLLDGQGRVIGVNSQIEAAGGAGNVGIGFAVPINTAKNVATQIIEDGKVEHAWLGVGLQDITEDLVDTVRLPVDEGVMVTEVVEDSPAEQAGLEGGDRQVTVNGESYVTGGDVITEVDGEPVESSDDLRDAIAAKQPGDEITLELNRDGATRTVTVELGRRPPPPNG
jgi:S1-C subfamily serine protease